MQVFPSVKGLRGIPPVGGVGMGNFVEGRFFFSGGGDLGGCGAPTNPPVGKTLIWLHNYISFSQFTNLKDSLMLFMSSLS